MVTITIRSRVDTNFELQIEAYVLKNITSCLPERKLEPFDWIEINGLYLADPEFNIPNKIDMLFGANVYSHILKEGMKRSPNGNFIAQSTKLGWIISGTVNERSSEDKENSNVISVLHTRAEEDILKKFWELEEQLPRSTWSEEEQACEEIFKRTTNRTPEGRYIVNLPFREDFAQCQNNGSLEIAIAKFKSLEKRLSKDLELKASYKEMINEYLQLGHMRTVEEKDEKAHEAVYLPHHAVVRMDKSTSKVRVVFNASSKNKRGVSLNDCLMVGPKLQPDLRHLVFRWRIYPIVMVADIVKMYRQVRIAEQDAKFQRIVWRDNPEDKIKEFELMTVTFGTASAPYLAVRALKQLSDDEAKDYPIAAPQVKNHSTWMT
ncbi:uncharacterized protein LOC119189038 [Manduca sexta]|uniref:uncharacterized protein LOC119189038 n=1 Tax=Manduca sexta TaxID=7130 RepID=UPI00188E935B|nr:uncharacterized protein LOC119189038 [Manduca sexta]